jgi:hypothetical protein
MLPIPFVGTILRVAVMADILVTISAYLCRDMTGTSPWAVIILGTIPSAAGIEIIVTVHEDNVVWNPHRDVEPEGWGKNETWRHAQHYLWRSGGRCHDHGRCYTNIYIHAHVCSGYRRPEGYQNEKHELFHLILLSALSH